MPAGRERATLRRVAGSAILTLLCGVLLAPSAPAAVTIAPDRIEVEAPGARATITRRPFRVSFADGGGQTVLSQVPNTGQSPNPLLPLPDPEPLGTDNVDGPTLYAPLTFTVGAGVSLEIPAYAWVGNKLTGIQTGIQYSARDVVDAQPHGEGVRLVVSTSDPSGRHLVVTIVPGAGRTLRIEARPTPSDGVVAMSDSFTSAVSEAFRGFGGRSNALDQRGNDFYGWVEQQNTGAGFLQPIPDILPGTDGAQYRFPNGPTAAYHVQQQFVSSRGYGFLLDRDELSGWRMASDRGDAWQVSAAANGLDYVVAPGDAPTAIGSLTAITGRHRVPPSWAIGPALDRAVLFNGETPTVTKQRVEEDLANIELHDLPLEAYRIEGWQFLDRDYLRSVIERLHARGIKALVYFRPFVGRDEIGTDRPSYFDEAIANGYTTKLPGGFPFVYVSNFANVAAQIDFTNPAAVAWWGGRVREALDLGADGFMQDFGEQVTQNMVFDNGETGATMHNPYPVLFHRTTREIVEEYEAEHPGREVFFYTRTGYSGTPGSAAYEGANFPGDENTDFSRSSGLASLTTDMLNRAVGGAFGYHTDIGGYFDFVSPATTKELLLRWAAWAALSPGFRLHGSVNAGTHTPWSYDEETVEIYKRLTLLHMRAQPLILDLWRRGVETGIPPTRPLWLQFPDDPEAAQQDQEWMLGPDVLVAPVVSEGADSREVYFPAGCWQRRDAAYSEVAGESYTGPTSATVGSPLGELPYFTRCGTDPFAVGGEPRPGAGAGPGAGLVAPAAKRKRRCRKGRKLVKRKGKRRCARKRKKRP